MIKPSGTETLSICRVRRFLLEANGHRMKTYLIIIVFTENLPRRPENKVCTNGRQAVSC